MFITNCLVQQAMFYVYIWTTRSIVLKYITNIHARLSAIARFTSSLISSIVLTMWLRVSVCVCVCGCVSLDKTKYNIIYDQIGLTHDSPVKNYNHNIIILFGNLVRASKQSERQAGCLRRKFSPTFQNIVASILDLLIYSQQELRNSQLLINQLVNQPSIVSIIFLN